MMMTSNKTINRILIGTNVLSKEIVNLYDDLGVKSIFADEIGN